MHWVYFSFLILTGSILSWQDFKIRLLSLWLIIAFGAANTLLYLSRHTYYELFENAVFCTCYLLFSYLVLLLYFYIKTRRIEKIIDTRIGLGDVLIFLVTGFCLPPEHMIFFFTAAMIIALVTSLFLLQKQKGIPLAGIVILNYIAYLILYEFF